VKRFDKTLTAITASDHDGWSGAAPATIIGRGSAADPQM
jgi:hypothetical protein